MLSAIGLVLSNYIIGLSRQWKLSWSREPSCFVLGTEITCEGAGLLTSATVKEAGIYTRYTSVIIKGCTEIGDGAFLGCEYLENVQFIGDTVKSIASAAFQDTGYYKPWNFTVPKSCGYLPVPGMTWNCARGLAWIEVASGNANYTSYEGCLYSKDKKTLLAVPPAIKELKFASGVTVIAADALRWYQGTTITFPDTVTTVGLNAMYSTRVETLYIPSSVTSWESGCLEGSANLTTVTLAGGTKHELILEPGKYLAKDWSGGSKYLIWISPKISSVTIPKWINTLRVTAVQGADKLTSISFASGSPFKTCCNGQLVLDSAGTTAVAAVGGIKEITIPTTVTKIGGGCFRDCEYLEKVIMHSGITSIGSSALRLTPRLNYVDLAGAHLDILDVHSFCRSGPIVTLTGTQNVKNIVSEAFIYSRVHHVNLPSVKNISGQAFKECQELRSVVLRDVERIETGAFYGCPLLSEIDLSGCNKLLSISTTAIAGCDIGPTFMLPTSVIEMLPSCFAYNKRLTAITFNGESQYYKSVDGVVYNHDLNKLIICPSGLANITTLPSTRVVVTKAFYGCSNLYSVSLNDEIDTIEPGAFYDCEKIELVRLPRHIVTLGSRAFSSCAKLRFVLYCNSYQCDDIQGNPFPTFPEIYVIYDYQDPGFGGHNVTKILDHECNIPTLYFTPAWTDEDSWDSAITLTLFSVILDVLY